MIFKRLRLYAPVITVFASVWLFAPINEARALVSSNDREHSGSRDDNDVSRGNKGRDTGEPRRFDPEGCHISNLEKCSGGGGGGGGFPEPTPIPQPPYPDNCSDMWGCPDKPNPNKPGHPDPDPEADPSPVPPPKPNPNPNPKPKPQPKENEPLDDDHSPFNKPKPIP